MPWAAASIDANTYSHAEPDEVVVRAALLAAAALDLKRRIECESAIRMPGSDDALLDDRHAGSFFAALTGSIVVSHSDGRTAVRTTEDASHFVVGNGTAFFEVPATASDGRPLTAAELLPLIAACRTDAPGGSGPQRIPLHTLSRFSRTDMFTLAADMDNACLANGRSLRALNRALFHVVLADSTMQSPSSGPVLALDGTGTTAQWLPAALTLVVYPDGSAVVRSNALFCSSASLVPCTAWMANAAATDTLVAPPPARPRSVTGKRKATSPAGHNSPPGSAQPGSRGATPAGPAGQRKGGKGAPVAPVAEPPAEEEVVVTYAAATVPTEPRRALSWMPQDFKLPPSAVCGGPTGECSGKLASIEAAAVDSATVHLAVLLAAASLDLCPPGAPDDDDAEDPPAVPSLLAVEYGATPCDLQLRLCRDEVIDNGAAHLAELLEHSASRCAPLPSSVATALEKARSRMRQLLAGPQFVSLTRGTGIPCPAVVVASPPAHRLVQFSVETTRWPPNVPVVSIMPMTAFNSALQRRFGALFSVTVIGQATTSTGQQIDPARFAAVVRDNAQLLHSLLQSIPSGHQLGRPRSVASGETAVRTAEFRLQ